jgi:hypothetical protein
MRTLRVRRGRTVGDACFGCFGGSTNELTDDDDDGGGEGVFALGVVVTLFFRFRGVRPPGVDVEPRRPVGDVITAAPSVDWSTLLPDGEDRDEPGSLAGVEMTIEGVAGAEPSAGVVSRGVEASGAPSADADDERRRPGDVVRSVLRALALRCLRSPLPAPLAFPFPAAPLADLPDGDGADADRMLSRRGRSPPLPLVVVVVVVPRVWVRKLSLLLLLSTLISWSSSSSCSSQSSLSQESSSLPCCSMLITLLAARRRRPNGDGARGVLGGELERSVLSDAERLRLRCCWLCWLCLFPAKIV